MSAIHPVDLCDLITPCQIRSAWTLTQTLPRGSVYCVDTHYRLTLKTTMYGSTHAVELFVNDVIAGYITPTNWGNNKLVAHLVDFPYSVVCYAKGSDVRMSIWRLSGDMGESPAIVELTTDVIEALKHLLVNAISELAAQDTVSEPDWVSRVLMRPIRG